MDTNEIKQIFINTNLMENYNFLEEDLITLAKAFMAAGIKKEREACIDFVRSMNSFVADKLQEKREHM